MILGSKYVGTILNVLI